MPEKPKKRITLATWKRLIIGSAALCLLIGGCPPLLGIGGAVITGVFLGTISVSYYELPEFYKEGTICPEARLSDNVGPARVTFGTDTQRVTRILTYEGILPGFTTEGTTHARVEIPIDGENGTIIGTVATPEGKSLVLSDVVPGLGACSLSDPIGFRIYGPYYTNGDNSYGYQFTFESDPSDTADGFNAPVNIRHWGQDGPDYYKLRLRGDFDAQRSDESALDKPLPPPSAPFRIDAGPDVTIGEGESVKLEAWIEGGTGTLRRAWEPTDSLDNPTLLQPTASPSATTTYRLTVVDESGKQASDRVTVFVDESGNGVNLPPSGNNPAGEPPDSQDNPYSAPQFNWIPLSPGMDYSVNALTVFNGELIAGGAFTTVDGMSIRHLAAWDGRNWRSLANAFPRDGMVCSIRSFEVFEQNLFVGGYFTTPDAPGDNLISWDGQTWSNAGQNLPVLSVGDLETFSDRLVATTNDGVSIIYGESWHSHEVTANSPWNRGARVLCSYQGHLVLGGQFSAIAAVPARNIAQWDGGTWSEVGGGVWEEVGGDLASGPAWVGMLGVYEDQLIVGGAFDNVGGVNADCLARWDGRRWHAMGWKWTTMSFPDDMAVWNGQLYVCSSDGVFRWDGSHWLDCGLAYVEALAVYQGPSHCSWLSGNWGP